MSLTLENLRAAAIVSARSPAKFTPHIYCGFRGSNYMPRRLKPLMQWHKNYFLFSMMSPFLWHHGLTMTGDYKAVVDCLKIFWSCWKWNRMAVSNAKPETKKWESLMEFAGALKSPRNIISFYLAWGQDSQ